MAACLPGSCRDDGRSGEGLRAVAALCGGSRCGNGGVMSRWSRVGWLLLVVCVSLAWFAQMRVAEGRVIRAASVGTRLEQCANGTSGVADCTGSAWVRGDLNANKSLYREGD